MVQMAWLVVIKYEEVYLRAYETVSHARESIARYIAFYNGLRPHIALADRTPDAAYFAQMGCKLDAIARRVVALACRTHRVRHCRFQPRAARSTWV